MRDTGSQRRRVRPALFGRPAVVALMLMASAFAALAAAADPALATLTYQLTEYRSVGQDRSFRCDLIEDLPGPPGVVVFGGSRATRFRPADFRLYAGLSAVNCATQNFRPEDAWAISNHLFSRAPEVKLRCFMAVQATTFSDAPLAPGLLYDPRLSRWFPAALIAQQKALLGGLYTPNMLANKRYDARGLLLWNGYDARKASGVPLEQTLAAYTRTMLPKARDTTPVRQVRSHLYFRKTIQLFNRHGVTPVVVIMPYQPAVLAAFREAGWEAKVDRLRKYLAGLQKRYDLEVVDLLDIETFGGLPSGFYDGAHVTAENARRIVRYTVGAVPHCFRGLRYGVPPPRPLTPHAQTLQNLPTAARIESASTDRLLGPPPERGPERSRTVAEFDGLVAALAQGRVTRRRFLERALGLGLTAPAAASLLAACGGDEATRPTSSPHVTNAVKPDKLHVFNWHNELAPENKRKFRQRYSIEIVETYFNDNEQMLAELAGGAAGYDIVVPSGYAVQALVAEAAVQPLELRLLPNVDNLAARFRKPPWDPETDGKKYSVAYVWGTTGIAVRTDKVDGTVSSWETLWESRYRGRIDMLDDPRETLGAALKLLGYSLNTIEQSQLDEATGKLVEQKPLVRSYDSVNMRRNIEAGVPLVHTWDGDARQAAETLGDDLVAYVLPREGFNVWADNLCIPTSARSPFGAHLFIDFMCEPHNAADLVNYVRYQTPNEAATPFVDPAVLRVAPSADELERGERMTDLGDFATAYNEAWMNVQGA